MDYQFPFGEYLHPLIQKDQTPKKAFVLGVYASAVHARWIRDSKVICQALAVASEPEIFWDGDHDEAEEIIGRIKIPEELGRLEVASDQLNGPSARALDDQILAPLSLSRKDAWLCDCLPESRLNSSQIKAIHERYDPLIERYGLNKVTLPKRPDLFCDEKRAQEITDELLRSEAELLILLGDIPISQYVNRVSDVLYDSLQSYVDLYGYGSVTETKIADRMIGILPVAHPRQIGALGSHSNKWHQMHLEWEKNQNRKELIAVLDLMHTTEMGAERIRKNLELDKEDPVEYCRRMIMNKDSVISSRGKNWYVTNGDTEITINRYSYTIITAHKI